MKKCLTMFVIEHGNDVLVNVLENEMNGLRSNEACPFNLLRHNVNGINVFFKNGVLCFLNIPSI